MNRFNKLHIGFKLLGIALGIFLFTSLVYGENVDVRVSVPGPVVDPTNLQASFNETNGIVTLTWDKFNSVNLGNQTLYISDDGGLTYFSIISVGLVETYDVSGLARNQTYTFKLVSVDHIRRESGPGATTNIYLPQQGGGPPGGGTVCGNGVLEAGEDCDDGNLANGDGCSSICQLEQAIVCGNSQLEVGEDCDDGNTLNGDGCSNLCRYEAVASSIDQPVPNIIKGSSINLDYSLVDPRRQFSSLELYFSHNGLPYQKYPISFISSPINMVNLDEGVYQVYSIALDINGAREFIPSTPDAVFTVDNIPNINFLAYPEKRIPRQGNWDTKSKINMFSLGSTLPTYTWAIETGTDGTAYIDNTITTGTYLISFKGLSHLTKFIRNLPLQQGVEKNLDYTFNNTFHLLAGDVHRKSNGSKDDYINGLDISALVRELYTADEHADLNQDGQVNGLDVSNQVVNLYLSGDVL